MKTVVSFPGLGIGEFTMNKVAFTLPIFGGLEIRWYAIILTLGIIAGLLYALYRAKFEGISSDDVYDYFIVTVLLAILAFWGHRANIDRLIHKKERKTYLSKKSE